MDFCHLREIYVTKMDNNYWILLQKSELDALKTASKKLVHKAAEATGEFIGNKLADKIVKTKLLLAEHSRKVEEIIIPPETREKVLHKLKQV